MQSVLVVALRLCIARHAERKHLDDFHSWKQIVKVVRDDFLQGNESLRVSEAVEMSTKLRHFHARKELFTLAGSTKHDAKRDGHVRDEWKSVSRIDREWREDRKEISSIPRFHFDTLWFREIVPRKKMNLPRREFRHQHIAPQSLRLNVLRDRSFANERHLIFGRERFPRRARNARINLPTQSADALHEEFIEIRAEDREKTYALKQRHVRIVPLREHTAIELEPLQVAIQKPRRIIQSNRNDVVRSDRLAWRL